MSLLSRTRNLSSEGFVALALYPNSYLQNTSKGGRRIAATICSRSIGNLLMSAEQANRWVRGDRVAPKPPRGSSESLPVLASPSLLDLASHYRRSEDDQAS